jgi:hypothetical protein
MNGKLVKSFLRHLLSAVLTAGGVILSTSADLNLKSVLITLGGAVIPVVVKYVDPNESDYGNGAS